MLKVLWYYFVGAPAPETPKCPHEWETVSTAVAGSMTVRELPDEYEDLDFDYQERLLKGVTTVLRCCKKCGSQNVFELLGVPV
jgi:hypothetical protein